MLPQIAIFISIELGACILEELVFDKRAELGSPIVICAGNNLPGEVCMTLPPAGAKVTERCTDVDTRGFRIVMPTPAPAYGWNLPNANLAMKFPINAPVLIQALALLLPTTTPSIAKLLLAPPSNPL